MSVGKLKLTRQSIGFGAPLPKPSNPESIDQDPTPLKGLTSPDLQQYGLIPEFLGRLPILSTLHPLSNDDLIQILLEPKNALVKQYTEIFERYGSELRFTRGALKAVADIGLKRGGGARGLRGVLEEVLGDAMFEVPGSVCTLSTKTRRDADDKSVRYCLITDGTVNGTDPARYYSRGQKHMFQQEMEDEDHVSGPVAATIEELDSETEEEGMRATG